MGRYNNHQIHEPRLFSRGTILCEEVGALILTYLLMITAAAYHAWLHKPKFFLFAEDGAAVEELLSLVFL